MNDRKINDESNMVFTYYFENLQEIFKATMTWSILSSQIIAS